MESFFHRSADFFLTFGRRFERVCLSKRIRCSRS